MAHVRSFVRREPALAVALLAAVVSCFFVPPDGAYLDYLDLRTLALLYALMVVVAGLRKAELFEVLAHYVCLRARSARAIGLILVCLCFFSAMFITNDVALLTFVPFAVVVLGMAGQEKALIRVVVLQTVAANLGSMLTPVGNPQNLYLYSYYGLSIRTFLAATGPVWLLSFLLAAAGCFTLPRTPAQVFLGEAPTLDRRSLTLYTALFVLCLLTVLRLLSWPLLLGILLAVLLVLDRKNLLSADFMLLLTFVAFFVFAGNLGRIEALAGLLRGLLQGREYLTALLTSQVISNVPAALLLSGFTGSARPLLLGVNVGGLGTPIASLASLISMKLYSQSEGAHMGKFLLEFTAVNVLLLLLLSGFLALI